MGAGGGGGKKGGSTPAPNFMQGATTGSSNPLGSRTWSQGPNGTWNQSTQFTGEAGNAFQGILGGMHSAADYDPTQARNDAIKSNYDQAMSRLNPRLMQQQGQFNAGAANSGLEPGTEAYNNANLQLQQGQNDALSTAMAGAIRQGNETQQTQMEQMRQPFLQGNMMMNMLGQQGNGAQNILDAQKAQYEAGKDMTSANQGKKGQTLGGLGSLAGTVFGGPLGGMAGGAVGNALGGGGGKKGGSAPPDNYFGTGDPMAGHS